MQIIICKYVCGKDELYHTEQVEPFCPYILHVEKQKVSAICKMDETEIFDQ